MRTRTWANDSSRSPLVGQRSADEIVLLRRVGVTDQDGPVWALEHKKASGRSSNFLISDAVESYVADQERMLAEVRQADRQVKSGHYIRREDMKAWLLSWGTDHELPPPKCVCGAVHDDEALCR